MLPIWLTPTQVRIIPIAERHIERSEELAKQIRDSKHKGGY